MDIQQLFRGIRRLSEKLGDIFIMKIRLREKREVQEKKSEGISVSRVDLGVISHPSFQDCLF